jgi:hypothetical protein
VITIKNDGILFKLPITSCHWPFQTQLVIGIWLLATTTSKPCATKCTGHNLLHKRELVPKGSARVVLMCSVVGLPEPAVGLRRVTP